MEETTFEVYGPHCCCSSAWKEEAREWEGERVIMGGGSGGGREKEGRKMKGRGEGSRSVKCSHNARTTSPMQGLTSAESTQ